MNIGNAIRIARTRADLTQKELAEATGLSESYLSLVERNQRDPSIGVVEKISKALRLPLPILFFLADEADQSGINDARRHLLEQLLSAYYSKSSQ